MDVFREKVSGGFRMNLAQLKKIDDYCWGVVKQPDIIRLYGSKSLLETMDDKVIEQISNVAGLPGLVGPAMTMPDAHWGYGFPIGGVAAFDENQGGIISAGGVGFDISCGVRCLRTNMQWDDCASFSEEIADLFFHNVPAGVGVEGKLRLSPSEIDDVLQGGARWAIEHGFGVKEDLRFVEEQGQMAGAAPQNVSDLAKKRQQGEMGTLGAGNHYCEIQVVDKIYDPKTAQAFGLTEGQVLVSIHCGSRGLGHQIGTDYLATMLKSATKFGLQLPEPELACVPIQSNEGQQYIGAMRAGINCALANRQIITHLVRESLQQIFKTIEIETLYDVSHNTCKREQHVYQGEPRWLYVHRKGATRAFGPGHPDLPTEYKHVGQPVLIGGSMGTGSYILAGNAAEQNPAFSSACHGAGRAMSRHQALKHWRGKELIQQLRHKGILICSRSMRSVAEEAPDAYKNVDEVALATEKAGLARRVASLKPKICVKG